MEFFSEQPKLNEELQSKDNKQDQLLLSDVSYVHDSFMSISKHIDIKTEEKKEKIQENRKELEKEKKETEEKK